MRRGIKNVEHMLVNFVPQLTKRHSRNSALVGLIPRCLISAGGQRDSVENVVVAIHRGTSSLPAISILKVNTGYDTFISDTNSVKWYPVEFTPRIGVRFYRCFKILDSSKVSPRLASIAVVSRLRERSRWSWVMTESHSEIYGVPHYQSRPGQCEWARPNEDSSPALLLSYLNFSRLYLSLMRALQSIYPAAPNSNGCRKFRVSITWWAARGLAGVMLGETLRRA